MQPPVLELRILPGTYAVCRLGPEDAVPGWAWATGTFTSVTRTGEELSVLCAESQVPVGIKAERGFRLLRVQGPLDFALTGILASLAVPLAGAGVGIFAVSTYDTDYLLVKEEQLEDALQALREAGHRALVD